MHVHVCNIANTLYVYNSHECYNACYSFLTLYIQYKQVDTEIAKQIFSWLSRYARISKHMNKAHFLFYILYLCDLHNRKQLK